MRAMLFALMPLLAAAPTTLQAQQPDEGATVYQKVLHSVAWVHSPRGPGKVSTGTGSLIDLKQKLILTNYHVVGDQERANVYFPSYKGDEAIAEKSYYIDNSTRLAWRGRVIARDHLRDLALIQLDKLPDTVREIALIDKQVSPGQSVHSIGNPGSSGALWVYTPGRVRQVYFKRWHAAVDDRELQFEAEVIETDSPTNPGDSGGPLCNDKGQLAGVTQGGAVKANLLSTFIAASEVRKFLTSSQARRAVAVKEEARTASLVNSDGGHFFSAETMTQINAATKSLYQKTTKDVVIETYAKVPDGKTDEVKAMNAEDRSKFFRDWARSRIDAERINGLLVLICREPHTLRVETASDAIKRDDVNKLAAELLAKFRDKQFDEGIKAFVDAAAKLLGG